MAKLKMDKSSYDTSVNWRGFGPSKNHLRHAYKGIPEKLAERPKRPEESFKPGEGEARWLIENVSEAPIDTTYLYLKENGKLLTSNPYEALFFKTEQEADKFLWLIDTIKTVGLNLKVLEHMFY